MTDEQYYVARAILIDNWEGIVSVLASDSFLRQELASRVSCRMPQSGSNIDSMPIEADVPPIASGMNVI